MSNSAHKNMVRVYVPDTELCIDIILLEQKVQFSMAYKYIDI